MSVASPVRPTSRPRPATSGAGRAPAIALGALLAAGAVYWIAIWTAPGQLVDQYVLDVMRYSPATGDLPHLLGIEAITDPRVWLVTALLGAAGALYGAVRGRLTVGAGLLRVGALLAFPPVIAALSRFLRDVVLVRPHLHDWIGETSNSAPSGHAAAASAAVVVLTAATAPRLRPVVLAFGATWVSVIGVGLIAAGWHRPSDVVISMLIVVGLGVGLPDPYGPAAPAAGGILGRLGVVGTAVVATPLITATVYEGPRQVLTAAALAGLIGLGLALYRPCRYAGRGRFAGR
ncbi:MAG: phosphatase PAP2 family protein [Gordonia sp. (in: high G+C Gram-positive bacteria)]